MQEWVETGGASKAPAAQLADWSKPTFAAAVKGGARAAARAAVQGLVVLGCA